MPEPAQAVILWEPAVRSREHYEAQKAARLAIAQRKRDEGIAAKLAHTPFWRHPDRLIRYSGWLQAYTLVLSLGTIALFIATGVSALILHNTDTTIRGQLEEMKESRRPWVSVVSGEVTQFKFDKDGLNVGVDYDLHNSGSAPALRVFLETQIIGIRFVGYFADFKAHCDDAGKFSDLFGYDIFPNSDKKMEGGGKISADTIDYLMKQKPQPNFKMAIYPTVVGCVLYMSPSDQLTHHTPFAFSITRQGNPLIAVEGGQPPLSELNLEPYKGLGAHPD